MEIKLKGFDKQFGLWVYGDHWEKNDEGRTLLLNDQEVGQFVDPETIVKWVGLQDKYDTDVYEGDIWRILTGYSHSKGLRNPSYKIGVVTLHPDGVYIGSLPLWANGHIFFHERGEIVGSIYMLIHETTGDITLP